MRVSALYIYPVKGCAGVQVKSFRFDALGPLFDRRFMLIDAAGRFVSQREQPKLALVQPQLAPTTLKLAARDMPKLSVPLKRATPRLREVEIWGKRGEAEDAGDEAASWFSQFLGTACRLVAFPERGGIPVDSRYARFESHTAFSDGYPVLLMTEASLADLNGRLERPVPMNRFRPNLVIDGAEPYAEDGWRQLRIGGAALLDVVKPCKRCVVTTIDQVTAQSSPEPLKTLASYRSVDHRVLLGQNCIHHGPDSIRVDDQVEVLDPAPPA
jgi:uncharacterized protein YcbX